ncbi:hypothetical protein STEG23_033261 [Scotinomys teguina]
MLPEIKVQRKETEEQYLTTKPDNLTDLILKLTRVNTLLPDSDLTKFIDLLYQYIHLQYRYIHLQYQYIHLQYRYIHLQYRYIHLQYRYIHLQYQYIHPKKTDSPWPCCV